MSADMSAQLGMTPGILIAALSIHAVPELVALVLPLAAWLVSSRRGQGSDLLAATFVTVAVAVPVLIVASLVETYATPGVIRALIAA